MAEKIFRVPCGSEQIAEQCLDACLYLVGQWGASDRLNVERTKTDGKHVVVFRGRLDEGETAQIMDLVAGNPPEGYTLGAGKSMATKDDAAEKARVEAARHTSSDADKAKAAKLFAHARKVAETRNYDYAIECYLNGLKRWPDAVEEGHKPLRGSAVARRHMGGKKPGVTDKLKYSISHKDALRSMLNAEWLFSRDPANLGYMEGVLKNANKAHCDGTVLWMGAIYGEAIDTEKKPQAKRFELLSDVLEELGDRCQIRGDRDMAVDAYERGAVALDNQKRLSARDSNLDAAIRNLSSKLTILKGHYQTADSFRESLADGEGQREIHDRQRVVQSDERVRELIAAARRDWEADRDVPGKLISLVDLLCRREDEELETQAIGLLVEEFKRCDNYQFKSRAEDIRRQQLDRRVRSLTASGDREAARQARAELIRFELPVFAARIKKYPNDKRVRFEYGVRLFLVGKLDEAIPVFQTARADPKNRGRSAVYLGRAFLKKKLHQQAMDVLSEALSEHEIADDETGKELLYWQGRSQEAAGLTTEAQASYGQILRMDYNYRDVRGKLDELGPDGPNE